MKLLPLSAADRTQAEAIAFELRPKIPVIDIVGHHSVCELNYYRLLRLLPQATKQRIHTDSKKDFAADRGMKREYAIDMNCPEQSRALLIEIVDSAPFTSTVELVQTASDATIYERVPKLVVRLYHDAKMAEIISWDQHRQWQPRYIYPNPQMYQPDEKLALNRFLADWLTFVQDRALVRI